MKEPQKTISIGQFKRLIAELHDTAEICIRIRMIGEMWYPNFTRVVAFTDTKVLLFDERINKSKLVSDISRVMQFEIDSRFQNYQPYFHYDIVQSE